MTKAVVYALLVCFAGVLLEAVCAGGDIRARLESIRKPRFAPPLWGWIVIGVAYYVVCFVVLCRLFLLDGHVPLRGAGISLALAFMLINGLWNCFFFRTRNLLHCLLIGAAYSAVALVLWTVLLRIDRVAAFCLTPYLAYLGYANFWGYALWKLNR